MAATGLAALLLANVLVVPGTSAATVVLDEAHFLFDYDTSPEPDPAVWTLSQTGGGLAVPQEGIGLAIVDGGSSDKVLFSYPSTELGAGSENQAVLSATVLTPFLDDASPAWRNHALGWSLVLDDGARGLELELARDAGTAQRQVRVANAPGATSISFPWDNDFPNTYEIARKSNGDFVVTLTSGDPAATQSVFSQTYSAASLPPSLGTPEFGWGSRSSGGGVAFWAEVHAQVTGPALANSPPVAVAAQLVARIGDASCRVTLAPADVDADSFDPDGDALSLSLSETRFSGLGDHPLVLTATDEHGSSHSASSLLRVVAPTVPEVSPKTINKKAKGRYVSVYLEFAGSTCAGGPADVDVGTVTLRSLSPPFPMLHVVPGSPSELGDGNRNGVPDRSVRFDRETVQSWFSSPGPAEFRVEGQFVGDAYFAGTDAAVQIIDRGSAHIDEADPSSIER